MPISQIENSALASTGLSATKLTAGTLPKAQMPTGSVLQVVSVTKTDTTSTNSSTLNDITGMTVSITPTSASSKIYVMSSIVVGTFGAHASVTLNRGGTDIAIGDAASNRTQLTTGTTSAQSSGNQPAYMALMYLDSPATTSATTYKLRWKSNDNGTLCYLNRTGNDTDNSGYGRFISTITVMEIAA